MTLNEFKSMIINHDLTYAYSDDPSCWRRGSENLIKIRVAAENFSKEVVVEVWNRVCDKKISVSPQDFYWKW